jgi:hypothetical protein
VAVAERATLVAAAQVGIERHQVFLLHKAQRTQLLLAAAVRLVYTTALLELTAQILFLVPLRQQVVVLAEAKTT